MQPQPAGVEDYYVNFLGRHMAEPPQPPDQAFIGKSRDYSLNPEEAGILFPVSQEPKTKWWIWLVWLLAGLLVLGLAVGLALWLYYKPHSGRCAASGTLPSGEKFCSRSFERKKLVFPDGRSLRAISGTEIDSVAAGTPHSPADEWNFDGQILRNQAYPDRCLCAHCFDPIHGLQLAPYSEHACDPWIYDGRGRFILGSSPSFQDATYLAPLPDENGITLAQHPTQFLQVV